MTLTFSHGPLAPNPPETVNYRIDGPKHRLLFDEFPRRVRAQLGSETVLDTRRGMQLYETGHKPQLYVPLEDVRADLLQPTDHHTHCPFKGGASYWSVRVGDQVAENAVWSYPEPLQEVPWLRGWLSFYFDSMDAWFDEDEEVLGALRDAYHAVDVLATSRRVRVRANGEVVAETDRPKLLSETGLRNRYYIARADVRADVLEPSATHTVCPYKGVASYHSLQVGDRRFKDAAWFYPQPLDGVLKIADHLSFWGDGIEIEVDGERLG